MVQFLSVLVIAPRDNNIDKMFGENAVFQPYSNLNYQDGMQLYPDVGQSLQYIVPFLSQRTHHDDGALPHYKTLKAPSHQHLRGNQHPDFDSRIISTGHGWIQEKNNTHLPQLQETPNFQPQHNIVETATVEVFDNVGANVITPRIPSLGIQMQVIQVCIHFNVRLLNKIEFVVFVIHLIHML